MAAKSASKSQSHLRRRFERNGSRTRYFVEREYPGEIHRYILMSLVQVESHISISQQCMPLYSTSMRPHYPQSPLPATPPHSPIPSSYLRSFLSPDGRTNRGRAASVGADDCGNRSWGGRCPLALSAPSSSSSSASRPPRRHRPRPPGR